MRTAKATLLPYVTPCGTFTRRNSKCFVSPSGLVVIDVDNLDSYDEAVSMRRLLFDDPFLCPVLTYVSPSGRGVKAFVPSGTLYPEDEAQNITESMNKAMQYVEMAYGPERQFWQKCLERRGLFGKRPRKGLFPQLRSGCIIS